MVPHSNNNRSINKNLQSEQFTCAKMCDKLYELYELANRSQSDTLMETVNLIELICKAVRSMQRHGNTEENMQTLNRLIADLYEMMTSQQFGRQGQKKRHIINETTIG